jgi:hypothetical protein
MTCGENEFANSPAGGGHRFIAGDATESKMLYQGGKDTLARIRKAVARVRRQKKIEKLASDANHWRGLS